MKRRIKINWRAVGRRVAAMRRVAGKTQANIASRAGTSRVAVSNVETGRARFGYFWACVYGNEIGKSVGDVINEAMEGKAKK